MEDNQRPDRLNMPKISAAAINAQANQGIIDKPKTKPASKPITETCLNCLETYDQTELTKIARQFVDLSESQYQNLCLTCIKVEATRMKESYLPDVTSAKAHLAKLTITYQQAHNDYNNLKTKYKKYDYLASMISHHLINEKAKAAKAKPTKATPKPETALSAAQKALAALAALSEDQRALILKAMNKGA